MAICPHCSASLSDWLLVCPSCQGEVPQVQDKEVSSRILAAVRAEASAPIFSREQKPSHALRSIWVFVGLGPYFGFVGLLGFGENPILAPLVALYPLVLIPAYILGLLPALLAGLFYIFATAMAAVWLRLFAVHAVAGATIGAVCGLAACYLLRGMFIRPPPLAEIHQLLFSGALAGFASGWVAGRYLPVGRRAVSAVAAANDA